MKKMTERSYENESWCVLTPQCDIVIIIAKLRFSHMKKTFFVFTLPVLSPLEKNIGIAHFREISGKHEEFLRKIVYFLGVFDVF